MPKYRSASIIWMELPEDHDYSAAASYLTLVLAPDRVRTMVASLRRGAVTSFKAKDIFRASGLSLLGVSNSHVKKDQKKIRRGTPPTRTRAVPARSASDPAAPPRAA
jgi:hypothetical protein